MTTLFQVQQAVETLRRLPAEVQPVTDSMAAQIDKIQASTAWSDSYKAEQVAALRQSTAQELARIEQRATDAYNVVNSFTPTSIGATDPNLREQQIARAAGRMNDMLAGGLSPLQVVRQAVADQDEALLLALREGMPAKLMSSKTASIAERQAAVNDFRRQVDKGMAFARPLSDFAQYWLASYEADPLAQLAASVIATGKAVVDGTGSDWDMAVRTKLAKQDADRKAAELGDIKQRMRNPDPVAMAQSMTSSLAEAMSAL